MKTVMFLAMAVLVGVVAWAPPARAENFPERSALMLQPMGFLSGAGHMSLEYEIGLNDYFGVAGRLTAISHFLMRGGKDNSDPGDDYDWIYDQNGFGVGFSGRYYPGGNAPEGFYYGLRLDLNRYFGTYENRAHNLAPVDTSLTATLIHAEIGYKFVIAHAVIVGPFFDIGLPVVAGTDTNFDVATIVSFIVGGGLYIGWAF